MLFLPCTLELKINSLHATSDLCPLRITFENSFDPVEARRNVGPHWVQTVRDPNGT